MSIHLARQTENNKREMAKANVTSFFLRFTRNRIGGRREEQEKSKNKKEALMISF